MKLHKHKYLNVSKFSIFGDSRGVWPWPHPPDSSSTVDADAGNMVAELAGQLSLCTEVVC